MSIIRRPNRRQIGIILNIIAIVLVLGFIFGNSLLDKQESSEVSSNVLEALEPVIEPVAEMLTEEPVTEDFMHYLVRKLAHFTEFAVLGCFSALLLLQLCGTWRTQSFGYLLFGPLFTAVADEFLQSFMERGPDVRDVVLDFSGAVTGILVTLLLFSLIRFVIQQKKS